MASELLAPAGDFDTALAAFAAGADAVYCGLDAFSARAFATNFTIEILKDLLRVARAKGKKVYITMNTVLDESQLDQAEATLAELARIEPDGIIMQDLGLAALCKEKFPNLVLHASTQLVAHNLEGVLALKEFGFKRVVLARELSIAEIESIKKRCGVELEVFIHGALCYSVSGLCLFSAMEKGRSGNRGKCAYCCRQQYTTADGGKTLAFSMKDLRAGELVRQLSDLGVDSLKIEGRMKSPLYVASVVRYYRQLLDGPRGALTLPTTNPEPRAPSPGRAGTPCTPPVTTSDLETVFSRKTTPLYLGGKPAERVIDPTNLGHQGTEIGKVKKVTKDREGRRWLRFHTLRALEKHDGIQFAGVERRGFGISEMRYAISRAPVFEVAAGSDVELLIPDELEVTPGEKIFCSMSNAVKRMFPIPSFRRSDYPGIIPLDIEVTLSPNKIIAVATNGRAGAPSHAALPAHLDPAKNPEKTAAAVRKAFSKLGDTDYYLRNLTINDPDHLFVPASLLNDLRRDLLCTL